VGAVDVGDGVAIDELLAQRMLSYARVSTADLSAARSDSALGVHVEALVAAEPPLPAPARRTAR